MSITFKTRASKDSTPIETIATIDWSGVSTEELQKLAEATVIIRQQAVYRAGTIPATDTINVRAMLDAPRGTGGFKATPENTAARIAKMSRDDYRKTLENLGVPAKDVEKMVNAKFAS